MIRQTVPFFGVSSMADSLSHYVDHLGFTLNHTWEPDGQIRWCWLQHAGGASLMMQQHYTEGLNARVYEGVLGEGIRFAYLEAPSRDVASASEMSDNWPFDGLASVADCDGYTLLARRDNLSASNQSLTAVVPILSVSSLELSQQFYVEGLGFDIVDRIAEGGKAALRVRRDVAEFVLHIRDGSLERPGQGVGVFHMVDDAISLYREITARGVKADEPYVGNRQWVAGLVDPDGYRISFESPTDDPEEKTLCEMESEQNRGAGDNGRQLDAS